MPSVRATRRASSTASLPQQAPKGFVASPPGAPGQTRIVTPMTSCPRSTSIAAATDESTPPDMPTTTRERSVILSPRAGPHQLRQALELLGVGVRDLDRPGALG